MKWQELITSKIPFAEFKSSYGVCYLHFKEEEFSNWIAWSNAEKRENFRYVNRSYYAAVTKT